MTHGDIDSKVISQSFYSLKKEKQTKKTNVTLVACSIKHHVLKYVGRGEGVEIYL
jgi:hypothetical protein